MTRANRKRLKKGLPLHYKSNDMTRNMFCYIHKDTNTDILYKRNKKTNRAEAERWRQKFLKHSKKTSDFSQAFFRSVMEMDTVRTA